MITLETDLKQSIKRILGRHHGRKNAITRRELRDMLELSNKEDRKLRLLIGEIRKEGLPILFATEPPAGYYLPDSLAELNEGMDKMRSYIIDECCTLRDYKVLGSRYLVGDCQGKLL